MKLKKDQITALIAWVSEGLKSDEINARARKFKPPFTVTRQQVDHYRKTRAVKIKAITDADETNALITGLSRREVRVTRLMRLAEKLEADLIEGGKLWLDQKKSVGSGPAAEVFDYEEFNKAELESLRGLYDDIAREVGHRKLVVTNDWREELSRLGINVDRLYENMVTAAAAALAESDDDGSNSGGQAPTRIE